MSFKQIADFLKLIRLPNLLVVALTQGLVFYRILRPAFTRSAISGALTDWKFFELLTVTLCITISGYLVNDLLDTRADDLNRPGSNPVQRLGRDVVVWFYSVSMMFGFLVSLLLSFRLGERQLLWIFPVVIGVLTVYSTTLKKLPAIGNIVVSLYCAGVPGVLLLAERRSIAQLYDNDPQLATDTVSVCLLFMTFAFIATWLRELVKDMEDVRGDTATGCRTIPVLYGIAASRRGAQVLGLLVMLSLLLPIFLGWPAFLAFPIFPYIVLLLLAVGYLLFRISRAGTQRDWHRVSQELKFLLLFGLGILLFY